MLASDRVTPWKTVNVAARGIAFDDGSTTFRKLNGSHFNYRANKHSFIHSVIQVLMSSLKDAIAQSHRALRNVEMHTEVPEALE